MYALFAVIKKELLLLCRDRSGMLVLFVMPAALVLVISLVQENILKLTGETGITVLLVDQDKGSAGHEIASRLSKSPWLRIVRKIDGKEPDEKAAIKAVWNGDFLFCIVLPENFTKSLHTNAENLFFNKNTTENGKQASDKEKKPSVMLYFDPTTRGSVRAAANASIQGIVLAIEMETKIRVLSDLVREKMNSLPASSPLDMNITGEVFPDQKRLKESIVSLEEKPAGKDNLAKLPTSVQQNIPAWALFGMFFIVVPLSATLIRERREGALARILTMDISPFVLVFGKVAAYVLICGIQFCIVLILGRYVLPMFGTPTLEMSFDIAAITIVTLSSALAATGYGVLLGSIARTYEQASTFGPVSIVIAAALGGIMVPVYVMPKIMRTISLFSPLAWGLNAYLDIFVRNGDIRMIAGDVFLLLSFFLATIVISSLLFFRKIRRGKL